MEGSALSSSWLSSSSSMPLQRSSSSRLLASLLAIDNEMVVSILQILNYINTKMMIIFMILISEGDVLRTEKKNRVRPSVFYSLFDFARFIPYVGELSFTSGDKLCISFSSVYDLLLALSQTIVIGQKVRLLYQPVRGLASTVIGPKGFPRLIWL